MESLFGGIKGSIEVLFRFLIHSFPVIPDTNTRQRVFFPYNDLYFPFFRTFCANRVHCILKQIDEHLHNGAVVTKDEIIFRFCPEGKFHAFPASFLRRFKSIPHAEPVPLQAGPVIDIQKAVDLFMIALRTG